MRLLKEFISFSKSRFSEKSYQTIKLATKELIRLTGSAKRYDGSSFADHSIGVALIVSREIGLGSITTTSALLHEIVRVGAMSLERVEELFGEECVQVLKAMNDISAIETKPQLEQKEHFQELIVSYSVNPRIILLKLADRLEVMRALHIFPERKRIKKSWESINIYAPIAHKLGLYNIKSEFEDISLSFLEPEDYSHISDKLKESAQEREKFIEEFMLPIKEQLNKDGYNFKVKGRTKSIYSIWRKMQKQKVSFEEVYDVFAIRIVVDCLKEQEKSVCWHIYSVVTEYNIPNPKRMRDWISVAKSNGYESLHATVVTDTGRWVEVQIRSKRMDIEAEQGIAAHWRYKGGSESSKGDYLNMLRSTIEQINLTSSSPNLSTTYQGDDKEILVFTPNGDLRKLQLGATMLDFAYEIHSDLGNHCVGGRVNHKNVTIRQKLKNGDLVEVKTSKNQNPKQGWLNIAITTKAHNRIKAFLRENEAKLSKLGKEELERKIKNWKINITSDEAISLLTRYYKKRNGKEFLEMVVDNKIAILDIKELLIRHQSGENILRTTDEKTLLVKEKKSREKKGDYLIIDAQQKGMDYKFAKCCNPIYGDDIFSFVSVTNGFTIHRQDCVNAPRLREKYEYRILPARWNEEQKEGAFIAKLSIVSEDVIGLENSIRDALKELKINLRGMSMNYDRDLIKGVITIEVTSNGFLDTIIHRLLKIKGVKKAVRV
ncbi:MAG: HD domain-containing protein [Rikenellaceae bacterium]